VTGLIGFLRKFLKETKMKKYDFKPGPRCGNCHLFDHNKDKKGQPTNRYHTGAFCRKDLEPKECGDAFISRHNGGKKKRNCKPWQKNNI